MKTPSSTCQAAEEDHSPAPDAHWTGYVMFFFFSPFVHTRTRLGFFSPQNNAFLKHSPERMNLKVLAWHFSVCWRMRSSGAGGYWGLESQSDGVQIDVFCCRLQVDVGLHVRLCVPLHVGPQHLGCYHGDAHRGGCSPADHVGQRGGVCWRRQPRPAAGRYLDLHFIIYLMCKDTHSH